MRRAAAAALALGLGGSALAQDRPGDFDFYVLSLTWAPSYCETADRPDPEQCEPGGALHGEGFVVHGLWPQYERGWPEYCAPSGRLPASIVASVSDLMPAGLAQHEWEKHGTCTGLRPERYFDLTRRAFEAVNIPDAFDPLKDELQLSPIELEEDFVVENPGMSGRGIAVACSREGLIEMRICMTRTLGFRRCLEVDEKGCRAMTVTLPAMP